MRQKNGLPTKEVIETAIKASLKVAELKSKVRLSGDAWLQSCPGGETAISQQGAANL